MSEITVQGHGIKTMSGFLFAAAFAAGAVILLDLLNEFVFSRRTSVTQIRRAA